jgi:hypothetical protein
MNECHSFTEETDMEQASGNNSAFSHTLRTRAAPHRIWALWTNPDTWSLWDGGLKSASLTGPFKEGSQGTIIALNGTKSPFTVGSCVELSSSTFVTNLPLAKLVIKRSLTKLDDGGTEFTHDVSFTGVAYKFWGFALGRGFRKELPKTMAKLLQLAEEPLQ